AWQTQLAKELYLASVQRLSTLSRARCLLLCNDRYLAQQFSTVSSNIRIHPIPTAVMRREPNLVLPLRVGLLGAARYQKGFRLALNAFRQLQGEGAPFNWLIQTSPAHIDNETLEALCAANVEHVNYLPTNDQYRELMRSLSILILPYDPVYYSNYQS